LNKLNDNKAIGLKIFNARKNLSMSRAELGKLVNLHESTVKRYEDGQIKSLDIDKLKEFARALNISPIDLLGWNGKHDTVENSVEKVTKTESQTKDSLPPLTPKDEREIVRDLEKMLNSLDDKSGMAAYNEPEDEEDRELLRASLEYSMRLAKQMAKKKFTPKKYRKD